MGIGGSIIGLIVIGIICLVDEIKVRKRRKKSWQNMVANGSTRPYSIEEEMDFEYRFYHGFKTGNYEGFSDDVVAALLKADDDTLKKYCRIKAACFIWMLGYQPYNKGFQVFYTENMDPTIHMKIFERETLGIK